MSTTVRERDRERGWDDRSFHEDRPRGSVTVRRYKVPDREDDRVETASRYSRRENLASPRHSEFRGSSNVREFRFERDVETDRVNDRDLSEYRSERARSPPREDYREVRIEREISRDPPRRERERDRDSYELDHYTKTVDYYEREREPREAPQPIYIRNDAPTPIIIRESAPQPIIIREERPRSPARSEVHREREERRTEVEHKSEVNEERTVAKREPSPQEDEYYYQKTTREVAKRDRDDYDDYRSQREVRPHESASQYGRRDESEDYYYRREEYNTGERARSKSRHRLHLAEGAIAGLAAGGLMNSRRKKEGEKSGGIKNLVGGAIVGTAATEIASRARSRFRGSRSRSGSRERSFSRGPRRRHRGRSDSRSRSRSRSQEKGFWNNTGNLGKLGAVAAIGALAGYAASRRGKNKEANEDRRSRSRVRHSSRSRSRSLSVDSNSARSKSHRNSTMAKAGLASAAVAGVVDRVRSRSRGGRSKSRIRTGAPIAAAGIGGAALAGLYERHKAKKEDREATEQRARSRSRSAPGYPDESRSRARSAQGDRGLIEYGDDPIGPAGNHERSQSRADSYYGEYAARRRSRSSSGSGHRRRYASRSRSRDRIADTAAGAGIAGVAAHEASQRRERMRAERRHGEDTSAPPPAVAGAPYDFGPYAQQAPPIPVPPPQGEYAPQPHEPYYQPENFVAPNAYSPMPQFVNSGPPPNGYDANAYQPPPGGQPGQGGYGYQQQPGQYPPQHNVSSPFDAFGQARADVNESNVGGSVVRRMSQAEEGGAADDQSNVDSEGTRSKRGSKSVMFDLRPSFSMTQGSPDVSPRSLATGSESRGYDGPDPAHDGVSDSRDGNAETRRIPSRASDDERFGRQVDQSSHMARDGGAGHGRRNGAHDEPRRNKAEARRRNGDGGQGRSTERRRNGHEGGGRGEKRRRSGHERSETNDKEKASDDSDETILLPDRFDSDGRKKPEAGEHMFPGGVDGILPGPGQARRMFQSLAQELINPFVRRTRR